MLKQSVIIMTLFMLSACNIGQKPLSVVSQGDDSVQIILKNRRKGQDDACNFEMFMTNVHTPKLAKDIYQHKDWNLEQDDEALALLDSLNARNKSSRAFYFKVVTMMYEKSDGYFSEGLGLVGKEFVEHYTEEFASHFEDKICFTKDDLNTWANIVMLEMAMYEAENKREVEKYIRFLQKQCKSSNEYHRKTINEFSVLLRQKSDRLSAEIKKNTQS